MNPDPKNKHLPQKSLPGSLGTLTAITWLQAGFFLTAINLLAASGNFFFQILMAWHLSLKEFGYLNAALPLLGFIAVPLAAGSQALTWSIARHHAHENEHQLFYLHSACQKQLWKWTWYLFLAALLLAYPLSLFFHFPRGSLMLAVLVCIPITLWSSMAQVWCAGLSQFHILGGLNFLSTIVRLATGFSLVLLWPCAESGVLASLFAASVFASTLIKEKQPPSSSTSLKETKEPNFQAYLMAALAVGGGIFIFTQSDILVAQRFFSGDVLGLYAKGALLGRAIVWGAYPFLLVYLTQRSRQNHPTSSSRYLLLAYALLTTVGALSLLLLRRPLCSLLLQDQELALLPQAVDLIGRFSLAMVPIAVLQALGIYFLAARRLTSSYLFGALALLYFFSLFFGKTPLVMLSLMFGSATAALLILAMQTLILRSQHFKH